MESTHVTAIQGSQSVRLGEQSLDMDISQGSMDSRYPRPANSRSRCDPDLFRRPGVVGLDSDLGSQVSASVGQQQASSVDSMPEAAVARIGDQEFTVYSF